MVTTGIGDKNYYRSSKQIDKPILIFISRNQLENNRGKKEQKCYFSPKRQFRLHIRNIYRILIFSV